jgi:hypothetical protein
MAHYFVFVHGIGKQTRNSYDDFARRLQSFFPPAKFHWDLAYWADVLQGDEDQLQKLTDRKGLLNDFLVGSFGDLVAYSKLPYPPDRYSAIQSRFRRAVLGMAELARQLHDSNARLHIIGHSLGSVIASDGLYDLMRERAIPDWLTFTSFFTMGSPIALYGLRYGQANFTKPIRPPIWLNFYYAQDIAAFPLKELNPAYNEAVTEDICLPPNGFFRKLMAILPLVGIKSHSWYLSDPRVTERIARVAADHYGLGQITVSENTITGVVIVG